MTRPRLLGADKKKIRLASRHAVQLYFTRCAASGVVDKWLNPKNRYRKTATQTYENDIRSSTVQHGALIDYIAASAPAHLIDGWSYLGRSTDAILRGDQNAAIHSAYYAELRAAMSLLACEGIGVFNSKHPVINAAGNATELIKKVEVWDKSQRRFASQNASTHTAVWPLLHHWSSLKRASTLIEDLVAPSGYSLRQWLTACGIPISVRAVSKKWLASWGTDLNRLIDDRESRNMASYRPSELRLAPSPSASAAIEFVSDLWNLFEPTVGGKFPQLEKELLKRIVRSSGKTVQPASLINGLGLTLATAEKWCSYLTDENESRPLFFSGKNSDVDKTDCAFEVVSRAALLLFLATGSTRKHLVDAGYSPNQLEFFWRRLCEVRFDGPASSLPDDPIDIWSDIEASISDAKDWQSNATLTTSLGEWRRSQPEIMNQIVSFELAAVWGLVS